MGKPKPSLKQCRPGPSFTGLGALSSALLFVLFTFSPAGCAEAPTCETLATCPALAPDSGTDGASDAVEAGTADHASAPDSAPDVSVGDGTPLPADASSGDAADGPADAPLHCATDATFFAMPADPCVTADRYGIFVSATQGSDMGTGKSGSPVRTIGAALGAARDVLAAGAPNVSVYVCADADYAESVTLDASVDGASLFGGFNCDGLHWTYDTSTKAHVKAPPGQPALTVRGISAGIEIQNFFFEASDATQRGGSSIAMFASSATGVSLSQVTLHAGAAAAGADAEPASNYNPAMTSDNAAIAGHDAVGVTGGGTQLCISLCTDGVVSNGGSGGKGDSTVPTGGASGAPSWPVVASSDGAGGTGGATCSPGHNGANAPAAPGGAGASTFGTLSAAGWTPASGAPGSNGSPGQGGGGGGGGKLSTSGGGAGGGCGGCGGAGGPGGQGGGSSFAILSYQSVLTFEACTFFSGSAGNGGAGAPGQVGQTGGNPGTNALPGCVAGSGGAGGPGGGGGGGVGGISACIAYIGTIPNGVTTAPCQNTAMGGTPGAGAPGGSGGADASAGSAGVPGTGTQMLQLGS